MERIEDLLKRFLFGTIEENCSGRTLEFWMLSRTTTCYPEMDHTSIAGPVRMFFLIRLLRSISLSISKAVSSNLNVIITHI